MATIRQYISLHHKYNYYFIIKKEKQTKEKLRSSLFLFQREKFSDPGNNLDSTGAIGKMNEPWGRPIMGIALFHHRELRCCCGVADPPLSPPPICTSMVSLSLVLEETPHDHLLAYATHAGIVFFLIYLNSFSFCIFIPACKYTEYYSSSWKKRTLYM